MALISFIIADEIGGSGFIAAFIGGLATSYVIKDAGEILTDFTAEEGQLLKRLYSFPGLDTVLLTVLLTVLFSVFAHGITASPLSNVYVRKTR